MAHEEHAQHDRDDDQVSRDAIKFSSVILEFD